MSQPAADKAILTCALNGVLIEALAACARRAGREVASPAQARQRLGLKSALAAA